MEQNITLIGASKLFVCDESFEVIDEGAIAFQSNPNGRNTIIETGTYAALSARYPQGRFYKDGVILPSFVNAHIHFEFGNNTSQFVYGSFERWLESVMAKRDGVLSDFTLALKDSIQEQLMSGVGSVGAISSYGGDMSLLADSPLRVVYFNEAIGSTPSALDFLYSNFKARYASAKALQSDTFIPAIALHAPYSVHSVLAKRVLEMARKDQCPLSVHFLESQAEYQWLQNAQGWFKEFYTNILKIPTPKPLYSIEEFLGLFDGLGALWTHCLFATPKELEYIAQKGNVISCPRSNRLLCGKYLDLERLLSCGLKPIFGTDGKSSNNNLNMLDELRTALFAYPQMDIERLAQMILLGASLYPARALGLDNGVLTAGKWADISVFVCPDISQSTQAPLQFLLHSQKVKTLYINGKAVLFE
ncbi:hypothetical protein BKH46_02970 [Helicobacter sp. 12S02634-8]|uniref:aminofutalosine deaminase family hydrolase n=1 Tax=Helicobacter sp. 12S02634-8 TaxID=1476199 RepID=UPI000BA728C0|nr:aminofutalosine deaminase family hydrolase [Helicobacter sp. 12S02634-8]PAF47809.1 hypothetical protein BKH46_02970 [Helicobacter sp. 12S02634-8]